MATKAPVQVPGERVEFASQAENTLAVTDPRDDEIARLRALVASQAGASQPLVMEGGGANTARYKAESKHLHLTAAELDAKVKAGEVSLTDHHVLCRDGWYVNPSAQARANG